MAGYRCLAVLALLGTAASCATPPTAVYQGYLGTPRSPAELSVVHLGDADRVRIDDLRPGYPDLHLWRGDFAAVQLLPGEYLIEWSHVFGVSVLIDPSGFAGYERRHTVALEAGHAYRLRADRTTGPGYRVFFWIEDEASGQVIAGQRKP